jgi:hypothetical protein
MQAQELGRVLLSPTLPHYHTLLNFMTDGRSGYNSVEVAEHNGVTSAETDGRGGYNSGSTETKVTTDAETDGRSGYN